jgi:signal transduction histidine kinase
MKKKTKNPERSKDKKSFLRRHAAGNGNSSVSQKYINEHINAEVFRYIEQLKKVNEELLQARRAALNLMEDAILSKEALKAFNDSLEKLVEERTQELLCLKLEQQREILNAILIAQENERERIGEDLHNGIGQLLYAAMMKLDLIKVSGTDNANFLKDASEIINDAIKATRNVSFQLVPTVLRDFGLPTAIETMIKRFNCPKFKIILQIDGFNERLSDRIEFSIYRIIQELLNNCVKHAKATEIIVKLISSEKTVFVEVRDNGLGFEPEKLSKMQKGIGLQSVRNRIKLLQAKMQISSSADNGTSVRIEIDK